MGILRDEAGQLAKAEESYRAALALRPKSDSLHNNLGYNLLLQGKREAAAQEFRAALAIEPYSQVARNNLGSALASQPKQAVVYLQSVADPATAHSNLAAVMIEQGDYPGARKQLEVALGYKKDHEAALRNLQIVSELDGQASMLPAAIRKASRLQRLARGVGRAVLGIEDKKKDGDVQRTAAK